MSQFNLPARSGDKEPFYLFRSVAAKSAVSVYAVMAALAGVTAVGGCSPQVLQKTLVNEVELHGHRGARGRAPENTIPAFETALRYGMNTLELDTHLTADNRLVLYHDDTISAVLCREPAGTSPTMLGRRVRELTLDQMKQLDCGLANPKYPQQKAVPQTAPPSLDEFLQYFNERRKVHPALKMNLELKSPPDITDEERQKKVEVALAALEKAGLIDATTIQSFDLKILPMIRERNKTIRLSALFAPTYFQGAMMMGGLGGSYRDEIIRQGRKVGADVISPYYLYASADFVEQSHKAGMAVIPWTVNDRETMIELFECGVDGIISDYPQMLSEAWNEFQARKKRKSAGG